MHKAWSLTETDCGINSDAGSIEDNSSKSTYSRVQETVSNDDLLQEISDINSLTQSLRSSLSTQAGHVLHLRNALHITKAEGILRAEADSTARAENARLLIVLRNEKAEREKVEHALSAALADSKAAKEDAKAAREAAAASHEDAETARAEADDFADYVRELESVQVEALQLRQLCDALQEELVSAYEGEKKRFVEAEIARTRAIQMSEQLHRQIVEGKSKFFRGRLVTVIALLVNLYICVEGCGGFSGPSGILGNDSTCQSRNSAKSANCRYFSRWQRDEDTLVKSLNCFTALPIAIKRTRCV